MGKGFQQVPPSKPYAPTQEVDMDIETGSDAIEGLEDVLDFYVKRYEVSFEFAKKLVVEDLWTLKPAQPEVAPE